MKSSRIPFVLALMLAFVLMPFAAQAAVKVYDGGQPYAYVAPDAYTNGGIQFAYSAGISSQTPSMQRSCYLVDPTAYPSYWRSGQYNSPGDNHVIIWDGSVWKSHGANGNWHIKELDCSTDATADASLSASKTSIQPGESTTLTWASQYGKLRQATCTGTNFTTDTTVPGHFETVYVENQACPGGSPFNQPQANAAATICGPFLGQQWVPTYTGDAPYGGSKDVSPTVTTTYTYSCTNANGTQSSSVTVYVGANQCSDGTDNDHDGLVDSQDPGCTFTPPSPPGCGGTCGNPGPSESGDMPDLVASAISPSTVTTGHPVTLSSTITNNGGSGTGGTFTNLFQIDSDADHTTVTKTLTDTSPSLDSLASDVASVSYTFPNQGTWYVRACADNDAAWHGTVAESNEDNNCSDGGWTTVNVGEQGASLSADPQEVEYDHTSTLTWACGSANSASIDKGVGDVSPASGGTIDVAHIIQDTTYTLSCVGAQLKQAYTTVKVLPPTLSIKVSPDFVRPGDSTTVTWDATAGAVGCTVSGWGLDTSHATHGSDTVDNIKGAHTYTLTCNGAGSKSATVNILPSYIEK